MEHKSGVILDPDPIHLVDIFLKYLKNINPLMVPKTRGFCHGYYCGVLVESFASHLYT